MERKEAIRSAYRLTGGNNFYDGMITCSTLSGKAVCHLVWDMNQAECDAYLENALSGIPEHFSGKLLEVPVGTGILTMNFSGDGNKTKIAFHSRHLPKSVKVPSDTCNTRSAVCAILRLWVIIMMVCSYFFDVSLSNAMTSLLFCESKFPVGSSARIREGRVINARPIATLCC